MNILSLEISTNVYNTFKLKQTPFDRSFDFLVFLRTFSLSDFLTLGDDIAKLGDIDDVRDLVSSILIDENFIESELTDPSAAIEDLDVCVMKTWFNQVNTETFFCIYTIS